MNTYHVTLQKNAEVPPQEFYCDADAPADAIHAAMKQIGPCTTVVVACHLYATDTQARIPDFDVIQAKASELHEVVSTITVVGVKRRDRVYIA